MPIPAEGYVEVLAQKSRQGHMPAAPELDDALRLVGREEIHREADPEHQRQADRHVGIAGKIEIQLKRIGDGSHPGLEVRGIYSTVGRIEDHIGKGPDAVRKDDLLRQADGEDAETHRNHSRRKPVPPTASELAHHLLVMKHRSGQQMRKERREQRVVHEIEIARLALRGCRPG